MEPSARLNHPTFWLGKAKRGFLRDPALVGGEHPGGIGDRNQVPP